MKLEFSLLGDGTNVQVALLEMLGETETVKDRFYTQDHRVEIGGIFQGPVPVSDISYLFETLEEILNPPVIGGSLGHLHPYWQEREEVKRKRVQNLESK